MELLEIRSQEQKLRPLLELSENNFEWPEVCKIIENLKNKIADPLSKDIKSLRNQIVDKTASKTDL